MKRAVISRSDREGKKWVIAFYDEKGKKQKIVHFGAQGYQDYTQHGDKRRLENYLNRHQKDPRDYDTAGELSRMILWSAPNLGQGIKNYSNKHRVQIERRHIIPLSLPCVCGCGT